MIGITGRQVEADEQLFITYIDYELSKVMDKRSRQDELQENWNFLCSCERCTRITQITERRIEIYTDAHPTLFDMETELNNGRNWSVRKGAQMIAYYRELFRLWSTNRNFLKN